MRSEKQHLKREANSEVMEVIGKHYTALRAELISNTHRLKCSQDDEDLFHSAILWVATNLDQSDSDDVIVSEVKRKYYSLRYGLECDEIARRERLTYLDMDLYGEDNKAE